MPEPLLFSLKKNKKCICTASRLTNTKFLGINFVFSTHLCISCKIQASLFSSLLFPSNTIDMPIKFKTKGNCSIQTRQEDHTMN